METLERSSVATAKAELVTRVLSMVTVIIIVLIAGVALFCGHEPVAEKILVAILGFLGGMGAVRGGK